jgi:H+/Cl- antiporter ClcA
MGNYTYFGTSAMSLRNGLDWLAIPLCGVIGGFAGGLFSRILIAMAQGSWAKGFAGPAGRAIKRYPLVFAAICGLAAAACGIASDGMIYGTGYAQVKAALESGSPLPANFGVLKFLATTFASISGMPGGIFSPSLAVGAGIGSDIAALFHGAPLAAIMLLGMVSYFAGVVQAPITAFVIVTEMTDNHTMVVPLMAAAWIAHACSRLICREGVYHALARGFVEKASRPAT